MGTRRHRASLEQTPEGLRAGRVAHWKGVPTSQKTALRLLVTRFVMPSFLQQVFTQRWHIPGTVLGLGQSEQVVMAPSLWGLYLVVRQGAQAVVVRLPGGWVKAREVFPHER